MEQKMVYQAAAYVRLSKEDSALDSLQKAESNSITNQKQLIISYLKDKPEINLVSIRVDDGYTGTNYDRPAFQLMMEDIKAGRVNCVVVKDLSRFGREYIHAGKYIDRLFPYYGVRLIAINDHIDTVTRSASDDFNIMLRNLMNDNYCRDISVKIRSQFEVKRRNGEYTGAYAPYGYQKSEFNHNKLEIDPYAAGVVQDIFQWKIEGYNQSFIASRLMETGVLAPSEYKRSQGIQFSTGFQKYTRVKWTAVAVNRILTNPIYVGTLIQGVRSSPNYKIKAVVETDPQNWIVVENAVEPIISQKTFDLVQRLLKMDTRTPPSGSRVFPLAGLIVCGDCGNPMVRKVSRSGQRTYVYYTCVANKNRGVCSAHLIPEAELMTSVLTLLQTHISLLVQMDQCIRAAEAAPGQRIEQKKLYSRIEKLEAEEARYTKLKGTLYQDFQEEILSKEDYLDIRAQYESRLAELMLAKQQVQRELEQAGTQGGVPAWVADFLEHQNLQELTRAVAVACIEKIRIFEGKRMEVEFTHAQDFAVLMERTTGTATVQEVG